MILVDLYEQVLDGAQEPLEGVLLRVYPRLGNTENRLDEAGRWR